MPKTAATIQLAGQDEQTLRRWTRSSSIRAGLAQRARIVLAAAQGLSNTQIAEQVGCSRPTVIRWRGRYAAKGWPDLATSPAPAGPAPSAVTVAPRSSPSPSSRHPSSWASPTGPPARSPAIWGSAA
jgi:hypothetical protein